MPGEPGMQQRGAVDCREGFQAVGGPRVHQERGRETGGTGGLDGDAAVPGRIVPPAAGLRWRRASLFKSHDIMVVFRQTIRLIHQSSVKFMHFRQISATPLAQSGREWVLAHPRCRAGRQLSLPGGGAPDVR